MTAPRLLPCGDRALLAEFDSLAAAVATHRRWVTTAPAGVLELVPAARTVLVRIDPAVIGLGHAEHWLRSSVTGGAPGGGEPFEPLPGRVADAPAVELPVVYDGDDLETVAAAWGCPASEVADRHAEIEWTCAFIGFSPGFPYLVPSAMLRDGDAPPPLPPLPRRSTSRARVPAGAVALAAEYCGIYPRPSPGGWQLIGRTEAVLWDGAREQPALIVPGARVRFVPARARPADAAPPAPRAPFAVQETGAPTGESSRDTPASGSRGRLLNREQGRAARVVEPGPLTLVHDLGRPGRAALGVGGAGPFDRAAHRLANRLVGNDESAAALEVLLGGLALALPAGTWFAVTGATGPVTLDGTRIEPRTAARSERDGALLRLGAFEHGVRATLALRGGIDAAIELGSRSRDTLSGIGPAPLAAGSILPLGSAVAGPVPSVDLVPVDPPLDGPVALDVRPGPRRDWFDDGSWRALLDAQWTVSARSDRTGVRLDGPPLARAAAATGRELPSEGMLPGGIQVSPDGAPTVLGPDAPVTGGYPVIAVVVDASLDLLAQLRPGQAVRLRLATGRP